MLLTLNSMQLFDFEETNSPVRILWLFYYTHCWLNSTEPSLERFCPDKNHPLVSQVGRKGQSSVGVLEWRGSSSTPSDLRSTPSWALLGVLEWERISVYTLRSEEQPSWALLLKLLIINRGDKMKARLISLARRKYSLSICWLLNRLWLVSLSPRMGRETSLWPRQTSSSA